MRTEGRVGRESVFVSSSSSLRESDSDDDGEGRGGSAAATTEAEAGGGGGNGEGLTVQRERRRKGSANLVWPDAISAVKILFIQGPIFGGQSGVILSHTRGLPNGIC